MTAAAIPFVATAPARIPLPPFGTFGLDPARTITLPVIFVPQPAGRATLQWPVPDDPALDGLAVFLQAALATSPNPLASRFTNVVADRFRLF